MKLTMKGNAPKDYDEIINHEDGTKWIKESRVIEILKGLIAEKKNVKDEGSFEVAKTRPIMGTAMAEGFNIAVSEQNAKIQAVIDRLRLL